MIPSDGSSQGPCDSSVRMGAENCVVVPDQGLREFSTNAESATPALFRSTESEPRQQVPLDSISRGP